MLPSSLPSSNDGTTTLRLQRRNLVVLLRRKQLRPERLLEPDERRDDGALRVLEGERHDAQHRQGDEAQDDADDSKCNLHLFLLCIYWPRDCDTHPLGGSLKPMAQYN